MISMKKTSRVSPRNVEGTGSVDVEMTDATEENQVDGKFEVMFVSMGQGECTLIRCPDGRVGMIDCGSKAYFDSGTPANVTNAVISGIGQGLCDQIEGWTGAYTYPNTEPPVTNKNVLDFLILTHCDEDHYNKILRFIPFTIRIKKVYYSNGPNSVGPDSVYREPNSIYYVVNKYKPPPPLGKYGKLSSYMTKSSWNTEKILEVVINDQERCFYTYDLGMKVDNPSSDRGGENSKYGEKTILADGEMVEVAVGELLGGWNISIVGGNVLKVVDVGAVIGNKRGNNAQPDRTSKSSKTGLLGSAGSSGNNPVVTADKTTQVTPPYHDSHSKNTASLITKISYVNNGQPEALFLMGDAKNYTFEFLKSQFQNNIIGGARYVICNAPHHSSPNDCNDFTSKLDQEVVSDIDFIRGVLKPEAVIASCRPFYMSNYFFPPSNVLSNYQEVVNSSVAHDILLWYSVEPNGGQNWVAEYYECNKSHYKEKKKKSGIYIPDTDNPPTDSILILSPKNGMYLAKESVASDINIPDLNYNRENDAFKAIYRIFPEPTA